jgi:hypothetical protein
VLHNKRTSEQQDFPPSHPADPKTNDVRIKKKEVINSAQDASRFFPPGLA